jgi:multiple sugar transport system substrate-binding protein
MERTDDASISSMKSLQEENAGTGSLADLDTHKISRRSFIRKGIQAGIGATALGPVLSSCGGGSNGPVSIQFAAGVDTTGEQTAEINKFNRMYAGKIKVDYLQLPPVATDQYNKFITTFQFQSPTPDVVQIDVTWPIQFALSGWLAPLDQYIGTEAYLSQFWPSARTIAQIGGKLYGIQRFMDIGMLYYRTDLVQKYGGKVPQTRDEMQAMAQEIVAAESRNGPIYGYLMAGKKIEALVDEWLEFIWSAGIRIGVPGNLVVNGPIQIAALQYMYDLIYTSKLAPPGTDTYAPNDILAIFNNGQAPFMRNWSYAYAIANDPTRSKVQGKVGIAPVLATSGNTGHGCTGGWVLGINAFSRYKDEAWTFINYMLSQETQTSLSLNTGLISSRPDVVTDPVVQAKRPYFTQLSTILLDGFNRPQLKEYNQFTTELQAAINGTLGKQSSPANALNSIQAQVGSLT